MKQLSKVRTDMHGLIISPEESHTEKTEASRSSRSRSLSASLMEIVAISSVGLKICSLPEDSAGLITLQKHLSTGGVAI